MKIYALFILPFFFLASCTWDREKIPYLGLHENFYPVICLSKTIKNLLSDIQDTPHCQSEISRENYLKKFSDYSQSWSDIIQLIDWKNIPLKTQRRYSISFMGLQSGVINLNQSSDHESIKLKLTLTPNTRFKKLYDVNYEHNLVFSPRGKAFISESSLMTMPKKKVTQQFVAFFQEGIAVQSKKKNEATPSLKKRYLPFTPTLTPLSLFGLLPYIKVKSLETINFPVYVSDKLWHFTLKKERNNKVTLLGLSLFNPNRSLRLEADVHQRIKNFSIDLPVGSIRGELLEE